MKFRPVCDGLIFDLDGTLWDSLPLSPYPGVLEGLSRLQQNYPLFLVSNCDMPYLQKFLRQNALNKTFQDSLCMGETGLSKQENIREIMARHGLKKAIYIGDTGSDQEAAYGAGAQFVHARYRREPVSVSCPAVDSFAQLVEWLTLSSVAPAIEVRRLRSDEFDVAQKFYLSVGYALNLDPQSQFYGAFHDSTLVGIVRLACEFQVWVLRGMQVHPRYQSLGLGSRLIRLLASDLGSQDCFCLPHSWLNRFYGQIGFQELDEMADVPLFLRQRWLEHRRRYPQLILMKRLANK